MGRRATKLDPLAATTEGERMLRELVKRQSFGSIARKLRADESTVRHYARGRRRPDFDMRPRLREVLGIPEDAWDAAPFSDVDMAAATTRRP